MSWQQLRRRLAMTKQQKQAAQLSRRDHVTQYVSWNPVKCCTAVVKISLEKACSRWQMSLDTGITAILKAIYHFQYWSIVKTTPSGTVCEILPCLQCSWLPMTLRSPAFKKKQLKLQTQITCTSSFTCIDIVEKTYYISGGMGVRKVSNSKVTTKVSQSHR